MQSLQRTHSSMLGRRSRRWAGASWYRVIKLLAPAGDRWALPIGRMILAASPVNPTPTASSAEGGGLEPHPKCYFGLASINRLRHLALRPPPLEALSRRNSPLDETVSAAYPASNECQSVRG